MACLGDASRFRIVQTLRSGELCVSDLAIRVELSQSCTTRHLQALRRDSLVRRRREGKRVLYALNDREPRLIQLLAWADGDPGAGAPAQARAARPAAARPAARVSRAGKTHPADAGRPRASRGTAARADESADPEESDETDSEARARASIQRSDLEDYLL
jgi:DNA-binding transcriptional ArsR family regulator